MANPDRQAVARFLAELYALGGFASWAEWGREAGGFAGATMSDYKRGENAPDGPNLLRLIHAATDRAPMALREAAERTSPLREVRDRLQALEERVAGLARAEDVEKGFASLEAAIAGQAPRRTHVTARSRKATGSR